MSKKIEWIKRGMTANNGLHMQEVCNQIADATAAINNSLQKPTTAPSATQIVTVDNTNTQTMLNIGNGLSIENGSLKASGGKLYYKRITLELNNFPNLVGIDYIYIYFYESNNTLYDINNINTLYEKIPFAICSIKYHLDVPEPPIPAYILGCSPHSDFFEFYGLSKDGNLKSILIPFNNIDETVASMTCDYTEV